MGRIFAKIVLGIMALVGIVGNVVASLDDDMGNLAGLGFGIIALLSIAALVVMYVRDRRGRQPQS
jgi:hypothetical protein